MKTKSEIRSYCKKKRDGFSAEEIANASEKVLKNITQSNLDLCGKTIMAYNSIRGEINLAKLENLTDNKIYYPTIQNGKVVAKSENFKIGKFGISEPTSGEIDKSKIDICFIPGVAFSKNMQRIGFGKGFYDEFLNDFQGVKIGITYEEFLFENITGENFDIPMDIIITEKQIITK